jgi:hypothetical protein
MNNFLLLAIMYRRREEFEGVLRIRMNGQAGRY